MLFLVRQTPDLLFLGSAYLIEPCPAPIFEALPDQPQAALQTLFGSIRVFCEQHAVCLRVLRTLGMDHNPKTCEFAENSGFEVGPCPAPNETGWFHPSRARPRPAFGRIPALASGSLCGRREFPIFSD